MIVLPISNPSQTNEEEDDTPQEWSLLELNGELVPPLQQPPGSSGPDDSSIELGSIEFDSQGTPIMTVGAHELKGKIEVLSKPFIIMRPMTRKRTTIGGSDENAAAVLSASEDWNAEKGNKRQKRLQGNVQGYEVAGVISKKVLFANYPKSIIN